MQSNNVSDYFQNWRGMVWHQLSIYSSPLAWGLVNSVTICTCNWMWLHMHAAQNRECAMIAYNVAHDQLLVCPGLNSTEVSGTLIATSLMLITLNITVHHVAGMLIIDLQYLCTDSLRYPCLGINSKEQSLLLYSLQIEHHRWEEPRSPGPICPCRTLATSTSCWSKFRTWPFLKRQLFYSAVVTGVHASTRKQWALQCPSSSALPTGHSVRLQYCMVGHVASSFGFCPLTVIFVSV